MKDVNIVCEHCRRVTRHEFAKETFGPGAVGRAASLLSAILPRKDKGWAQFWDCSYCGKRRQYGFTEEPELFKRAA